MAALFFLLECQVALLFRTSVNRVVASGWFRIVIRGIAAGTGTAHVGTDAPSVQAERQLGATFCFKGSMGSGIDNSAGTCPAGQTRSSVRYVYLHKRNCASNFASRSSCQSFGCRFSWAA
jgi:hypothetical protein